MPSFCLQILCNRLSLVVTYFVYLERGNKYIVQQMTVSKVARTMAQQERERPAAEREQQWQRGEELAAAGGRRHRQSRRQAGLIRGGE